jgi:hypothetical protein
VLASIGLVGDNLALVQLTGEISSKQECVAQPSAGAYGYRQMQFLDSDDILVASGPAWRLGITDVYVKTQTTGSSSAHTPSQTCGPRPLLLGRDGALRRR